MFDSNCLLQSWNNGPTAVYLTIFSQCIPKRADETENPEHPEMGNPNPEITYPNGLILGNFLRGNIPPLEPKLIHEKIVIGGHAPSWKTAIATLFSINLTLKTSNPNPVA